MKLITFVTAFAFMGTTNAQNGACPMDVKTCPDGRHLNRDPTNNCEFPPCNSNPGMACPMDIKPCPDGSNLNRDPTKNCEFPLCNGEKDCSSASTGTHENYLICLKGITYRDGFNNCEFAPCPDPRCELEDYRQCPAPYLHVYVARDPTAGASGCADFVGCPGQNISPYSTSGSSGVGTTAGLLASTAAAAAGYMAM